MPEEKKKMTAKAPEDIASTQLAKMTADESNFDKAFDQVVGRLREVTRKKHGTMRYRRYVIGPVAEELGIAKPDHSKVKALLGRITKDESAIDILNKMHRDHITSEAEAEKQRQAVLKAEEAPVTTTPSTPSTPSA